MNLFTDGTVAATSQQARDYADALDAFDSVKAQATADDLTAFIAADAKLAAAGIAVSADAQDEMWVVVEFPLDAAGDKQFWSGATQIAIANYGGKAVAENHVRMAPGRAKKHLAAIAALLP